MRAHLHKTNFFPYTLIDFMTFNTLLTGLELRLGQIIRAGNPKDLLEPDARIRCELQFSIIIFSNNQKPINRRNGYVNSQCQFRNQTRNFNSLNN